MKESEHALQLFGTFNCSQAVFSSFADELGIDQATALKLASGFGGGMACGETCGAVTASYLVIGMRHGHTTGDADAKSATKQLIRQFNADFEKEHGSLICKKLLGYDLSIPEEQEQARENQVFDHICPKLIQTACTILEKDKKE